MNILNFSHPLTEQQINQISAYLGAKPSRIIDVKTHFNADTSFAEQTQALFAELGISSDSLQQDIWLVVLPALNHIAAIVLAYLHGRMGHFPSIIRLKPVNELFVTTYELAEIMNLEEIRQTARSER